MLSLRNEKNYIRIILNTSSYLELCEFACDLGGRLFSLHQPFALFYSYISLSILSLFHILQEYSCSSKSTIESCTYLSKITVIFKGESSWRDDILLRVYPAESGMASHSV